MKHFCPFDGTGRCGQKVANCVCLFGYGRVGRVPVDVWIERLIRDEFAGQDPFPQFGLEAGIVQQYLFFIKKRGIRTAEPQAGA